MESQEDFPELHDSRMGRPVVDERLTELECVELNGIFREFTDVLSSRTMQRQ